MEKRGSNSSLAVNSESDDVEVLGMIYTVRVRINY
jgi:hypothetical protein